MVNKISTDKWIYFKCMECGFLYKEKPWAEKCEDYCKRYHACSVEITKHAVKF